MSYASRLIESPLEALACRRLLDLPAREREGLRRAVEAAERKRALLHRIRAGARPTAHPIALTPFVVPRRLVPRLHRLARAVHRFQAQAPELYRSGTLNFRELCPLEERAEAWLLRYYRPVGGGWDLLIRLDVGLAPSPGTGGPAPFLYETNATALAGLFNHTAGVEILRQTVFPKIFSPREQWGLLAPPDLLALLFDWVMQAAGRLGIRHRRRLGVAFVEPLGAGEGYSELPQIARYFQERGVRPSHGHPGQLRLKGERVFLKRNPVDLVYRDIAFGEVGDPPNSSGRLTGLAELLNRRAMIPGFSGEFDHKGILECLTSEAYRRCFSTHELEILRECVPWTRVLWARKTEGPTGGQIDLPRYVRAHKDQLLIKPNRGLGGERILLGQEVSASRWDRRLERALKERGSWVVQQRFPAARKAMVYLQNGEVHFAACYFSLGLFYVRDRLGLHCRVSPFPVVNVGKGGALACVFMSSDG